MVSAAWLRLGADGDLTAYRLRNSQRAPKQREHEFLAWDPFLQRLCPKATHQRLGLLLVGIVGAIAVAPSFGAAEFVAGIEVAAFPVTAPFIEHGLELQQQPRVRPCHEAPQKARGQLDLSAAAWCRGPPTASACYCRGVGEDEPRPSAPEETRPEYDSGRFKLARPKALTPAERLELGLHNFDYWFQSANEFWRGAGYYAARGLGAHAAFSLHQATERYFHAALLVFTGYKPKSHDIEALSKQTTAFLR